MKKYHVLNIDSKEQINWSLIPKAPIDLFKWENSDIYTAFGQLIYIKEYGFMCKLSCREEHPYVSYMKDGDPVYEDSAMEFFVSFSNENYLNMETNSAGIRLQEFGPDRYHRISLFDGSHENFNVITESEHGYWSLIIELPITKLQQFYPDLKSEQLVSGYSFQGNFYKIGINPETKKWHYGMWNEIHTDIPDFHRPEYFGNFIMQ